MIPALGDLQVAVFGAVDEAMLLRDAAGPPAGEVATEGFGLAGSGERGAAGFLDECVQAVQHLAIMGLPMEVILPGLSREDDPHSASSRALPLSLSSCATASIRRRALAGLFRRCTVSS